MKSASAPLIKRGNQAADVNCGSCLRRSVQICVASTAEFQAVHISTSPRSRQKKPLAKTPCLSGVTPVVSVTWLTQVTHGKVCASGAVTPPFPRAERRGIEARSAARRPGIDSRTENRLVIVAPGPSCGSASLFEKAALPVAPFAVLNVLQMQFEEFYDRRLRIDPLAQQIGAAKIRLVTHEIDAILVGLSIRKQLFVGIDGGGIWLVQFAVEREESDVVIGVPHFCKSIGIEQSLRLLRRRQQDKRTHVLAAGRLHF